MSDKKRLFLVDGSALAYRAHFAFIRAPLVNSKGENTSAAFGFTNALLKLLADHNPDYVGVVFDTGGPTVRHELFADYKANRPEMPDELRSQLPIIKEIVRASAIPVVEQEGYEADDILATLAQKAKQLGLETVLVSGDKDFLQLVDRETRVLKPRVGGSEEILFDAAEVERRYGVEPAKVIEVLGLMGDAIDNIPGVPGIGEKTAIDLVQRFGTIESILEHVGEIPRKNVREALEANAALARQAKELVTLHTDLPLELSLEEFSRTEPNREKLAELFRGLEFRKLLEETAGKIEDEAVDYQLIDSPEAFHDLAGRLGASGGFVFDLETTSLDPLHAEIVGISFSCAPRQAYYVPLKHLGAKNLDTPAFWEELKGLLEGEKPLKIGQNLKYDLRILRRSGIRIGGRSFDTMIASYLLDPSRRQHNLDLLALDLLNHRMIPLEELIGKGKEQTDLAYVPVQEVKNYSCEDADYTVRLKELFGPQLRARGLMPLFEDVEMPLVPVLADMEQAGVALDLGFFREMSERLSKELHLLEAAIYTEAGEMFNINSPRQLADVLFGKLKLAPGRRTKTGYSTDVDVLEKLAMDHPLPRRILDYRQLFKLKTTYIDAFPQLIDRGTGRLHTSLNQTVTETGRLSSSEPNLQNIPVRDELSREIRKGFVAGSKNEILLSADYSQIELRLVAHLSGDKELLSAFREKADVHRQTASLVFNVPPEQVTPELRRRAKVINFGIIYGMGPFGLAQQLGITLEEAAAFIGSYFARYPGVRGWIDRTIAEARTNGFITTLLGRRRYLPEIGSENHQRRGFAERTAINTPIQGTAADLIKVAMIRIHAGLQARGGSSRMILQIHDELLLEVGKAEVEEISSMVRENMERAIELSVPIEVSIGVGKNWYEAH
jgi:DNA polymerase-1